MVKRVKPTPFHFQLKVTLLDTQPAIWRRLAVPATVKLPKFDAVLQLAFGWTNSHLHSFQLGNDRYEVIYPDDWEGDIAGPDERHDEKEFRLGDLLVAPGDSLLYEYDFGDSWLHQVVVEEILPGKGRFGCLDGARAGPPEDCGGPPGYADLVEAMANRRHPERKRLIEWLGGPFDPTAFSRETLDCLLQGLKV